LLHCHSNFKRLNRMNISTFCVILVTFRPETSEFTLLTIAHFVAIRQKSAYHAKYRRMFWTYLNLLYRFGRRISGDNFPNIRFAAAQGTLLWQPVKYGRRSQTSRGTTFTLCFGIRQWFADRKSAFKRFNGNNQATSYLNFVNLCPVISEFTLLKRNFCRDSPAIWRRSSFLTLPFPNGLEDRNFGFTRVIGNDFCTTCRNLVRFGSVTPEFNT